MATVAGPIEVALSAGLHPVALSARSIFDVLAAANGIGEGARKIVAHFSHDGGTDGRSNLGFDISDLLCVEMVDGPALGTDKIGVRCEPDSRYLELVSAVASDGDGNLRLDFSHGWPILSVGGRTPTVAEAAGASSPGGEDCQCDACTLARAS